MPLERLPGIPCRTDAVWQHRAARASGRPRPRLIRHGKTGGAHGWWYAVGGRKRAIFAASTRGSWS
jgi:hypothetical protein